MSGMVRVRAWVAFCAMAVAVVLALAPVGAGAQVSGFKQAIAEAAAADPALAQFYAGRDYKPIWTTKSDAGRRSAFFKALAGADNHGLPAKRYDAAGLKARFETLQTERDRGALEVAMSAAFLSYAQDVQTGALEPKRVDSGIVREVPRRDRQSLLTAFASSNANGFLRSLTPQGAAIRAVDRRQSSIWKKRWDAGGGARGSRPNRWAPAMPATLSLRCVTDCLQWDI